MLFADMVSSGEPEAGDILKRRRMRTTECEIVDEMKQE